MVGVGLLGLSGLRESPRCGRTTRHSSVIAAARGLSSPWPVWVTAPRDRCTDGHPFESLPSVLPAPREQKRPRVRPSSPRERSAFLPKRWFYEIEDVSFCRPFVFPTVRGLRGAHVLSSGEPSRRSAAACPAGADVSRFWRLEGGGRAAVWSGCPEGLLPPSPARVLVCVVSALVSGRRCSRELGNVPSCSEAWEELVIMPHVQQNSAVRPLVLPLSLLGGSDCPVSSLVSRLPGFCVS